MKIQMLKSQPQPGGRQACYMAGVDYTLATPGELAMAQAFIDAGVAVLVEGSQVSQRGPEAAPRPLSPAKADTGLHGAPVEAPPVDAEG